MLRRTVIAVAILVTTGTSAQAAVTLISGALGTELR